MRTTFLTLAMMVVGGLAFGQAASINWMSLEEAVAAQQKEPRKIMMDVYTQWCGPCKMMMANTFTNANVIEYVNANYYAVKFDAEGPYPWSSRAGRSPTRLRPQQTRDEMGFTSCPGHSGKNAYPTFVYFDEDAPNHRPHQRLQDSPADGVVPEVLPRGVPAWVWTKPSMGDLPRRALLQW